MISNEYFKARSQIPVFGRQDPLMNNYVCQIYFIQYQIYLIE